jgi:chaperone required for assembly of F1-ATPase
MTDEPEKPRTIDPAAFATRPALPKRFYKSAAALEHEGGFVVALDGRPVRTPGRSLLSVPNRAFASELAGEWDAQGTHIDPVTMPLTRLVNSAIDGVTNTRDDVAAEIVRYSGSDLICYRADGPDRLVRLQRDIWDPLLSWVEQELGARFFLSEGIRYVEQPPKALEAVGGALPDDPLRLAALNLMTTLSGSALISLAVWRGAIGPAEAWRAAHIDEEAQEELWGVDGEALLRREARWRDYSAAARCLELLKPQA